MTKNKIIAVVVAAATITGLVLVIKKMKNIVENSYVLTKNEEDLSLDPSIDLLKEEC